jgi:ATP-dependent DNA helicase RecQ
MLTQEQLTKLLQGRFGFKNFRPGQLEAICALLDQDRLLCIQPTGHGKSLLYQLPSVLFDGITLVISPLLALMRDQIMQLNKRFNIKATSINSDQTDEENVRARLQAEKGHVKILFVAPEQLDNLTQLDFLLKLPVSLIVVDEAHCISTYGKKVIMGSKSLQAA